MWAGEPDLLAFFFFFPLFLLLLSNSFYFWRLFSMYQALGVRTPGPDGWKRAAAVFLKQLTIIYPVIL